MAPFLEVLTRCCRRPEMLAENMASLRAQTSADWMQTLLVDNEGRGVAWANQELGAYAPHLAGEYVWVLDDDDLCVRSTLVAELKSIAAEGWDVIMLRMDHGPLGVLPDDKHWQGTQERGQIGISAFVVRRELWQQHAAAWLPAYDSDFDFIEAVLATGPHVFWHDWIASRVQRISRGAPERG